MKNSIIANPGTNQTYAELLRNPLWQEKRLRILDRDKFICRLCGDKNTILNVHHKIYIPGHAPWEYDDNDLITYCECCHAFAEKNKKIFGLDLSEMKAIYLIYDANHKIRIYRYDETVLVYIFNSVNQIINSFPVTGSALMKITNILKL